MAVFIAVPAGVSALLSGAALWLARRRQSGWAVGLSVSAVVALMPLAMFVPGFSSL